MSSTEQAATTPTGRNVTTDKVRWAGRLALEVPDLLLVELAGVLESLGALPDEHAQRTLLALAERARKPRPPGASEPPATRSSQRLRGRFP
jgi:hypothetical protein